jgi:Na+/phosphate symporter
VFGAIGQRQVKKQVALSHVLFNVFATIVGFAFFPLMIWILSDVLSFKHDIVGGLAVFAI